MKSNRVVDALSRRLFFLTEMQIEVFGFKELTNLYLEYLNFFEAWKACTITLDRIKWFDFIIQDDMLLEGNQLCIPRSSMRENFIKEKHSGGLAGYFGQAKIFALVVENYYWPQLQQDVKNF